MSKSRIMTQKIQKEASEMWERLGPNEREKAIHKMQMSQKGEQNGKEKAKKAAKLAKKRDEYVNNLPRNKYFANPDSVILQIKTCSSLLQRTEASSDRDPPCTPMPTCLGPRGHHGLKPPPCQNPEKCLRKCKKKRIKCQSALAQMKDRRRDMKCKCLPKMNIEEKQRRKKADKLAKKRERDRRKHKAPKSSGYGLDHQKKRKKKGCVIL